MIYKLNIHHEKTQFIIKTVSKNHKQYTIFCRNEILSLEKNILCFFNVTTILYLFS